MNAASSTARQGFVIRGWHVLVGFLTFFGLVVGLDACFAVWAYRTFPGEVSKTAYEDGLAYNRTLAERAREKALGWTVQVSQGGRPGLVLVEIQDAAGVPIEAARVTATFARPATDVGAQTLALRRTGPGRYAGAAAVSPGGWDLTLTIRDAKGHAFHAGKRLLWR